MSKEIGWSINAEAAEKWAANLGLEGKLKFSATAIRPVVLLALIEGIAGDSSYDEILSALKDHRVLEGEVPPPTLRAAVSGLPLTDLPTRYELRKSRAGKGAYFRLIRAVNEGDKPVDEVAPLPPRELVVQLHNPDFTVSNLAWALMRDRRLPPGSLYALDTPAASWETATSDELAPRELYESQCFEELIVGSGWVERAIQRPARGIFFLALNVGESEGEKAILKSLLDENLTVHYLAVNTSARLLKKHADELQELFQKQIEEGRLVVAIQNGNFETDYDLILDDLKRDFGNFEFFRSDYPLLVTYFSNRIGSRMPATEWAMFRAVDIALQEHPDHAFLVGFAAFITDIPKEEYPRPWYRFLAATPRHLWIKGEVNPSDPVEATKKKEKAEFGDDFLVGDKTELEDQFPLRISDYRGFGSIRGTRYEFRYKTKQDIEHVRGEKIYKLLTDQQLLLYSIVKFMPDTLAKTLRDMGLEVRLSERYRDVGAEAGGSGREQHRYRILAAFRNSILGANAQDDDHDVTSESESSEQMSVPRTHHAEAESPFAGIHSSGQGKHDRE
jgi:hypothetical protein